jgi:hypothetical protein
LSGVGVLAIFSLMWFVSVGTILDMTREFVVPTKIYRHWLCRRVADDTKGSLRNHMPSSSLSFSLSQTFENYTSGTFLYCNRNNLISFCWDFKWTNSPITESSARPNIPTIVYVHTGSIGMPALAVCFCLNEVFKSSTPKTAMGLIRSPIVVCADCVCRSAFGGRNQYNGTT